MLRMVCSCQESTMERKHMFSIASTLRPATLLPFLRSLAPFARLTAVLFPSFFLVLSALAQIKPAADRNPEIVKQRIGQQLSFEKNGGQSNPEVRFLARGGRHTLFLTKDEAVLALRKEKSSIVSPQLPAKGTESAAGAVLRMKFSGADPNVEITGQEPLPGKIYYADAKSKGPLTGNATFRRVKYSGIYPGIEAAYYGNDRQLEFDFLIAPHADPDQIHLSFAGAEKISLTEAGEILLCVAGEEVLLKKPIIYQERDSKRVQIGGGYRLLRRGSHAVGFELAPYDKNLPLVIDPTISFATYLGTPDDEFVTQLRVNALGE